MFETTNQQVYVSIPIITHGNQKSGFDNPAYVQMISQQLPSEDHLQL